MTDKSRQLGIYIVHSRRRPATRMALADSYPSTSNLPLSYSVPHVLPSTQDAQQDVPSMYRLLASCTPAQQGLDVTQATASQPVLTR